MTVGDTHRHTGFLCSTKRKNRESIYMAVNNHPALLFKEALKLSLIFNYMLIGRNIKHPATKRFNLFTRDECRIGIDKKVKLHFTAVNVAVVIHDDSFDTTADHLANNLSYSNRFSHLASTATGKDLNNGEKNNF